MPGTSVPHRPDAIPSTEAIPIPGPRPASLLPLAFITLVFNLGGGLIAPVVPLYARSLGADYRDLGLIGASHGLAFAALTIPMGRASDRFGRRALLLVSALAVGGAAAVYVAADTVSGLIVAKFLEAIGWAAFWPALEAWVAERFGARAGTAMGVGYGAYAAAFVLGSSAAGFLVEATGLRTPFALYLVTSAMTVVLILAVAGDGTASAEPAAAHSEAPSAPGRRGDGRALRLLAYGTGFVYVYGLGTVLAFLPAHLADRGLSPRGVGLVVGGYWVARFIGSLVAGRVSDRLGRRAILVPAVGLAAGAATLLGIAPGTAGLAVGAIGLGLTAGACAPACVALIADHVRPADRGMAMGLFEAACGVSILVSGLAGGYAAQVWGGGAPYFLVAAVALGWTVVLVRRLPRSLPTTA